MNYVTFTASNLARPDRVIVEGVVIAATTDAVVNIIDGLDDTGDVVIPLAAKAGDTAGFAVSVAFNEGVYVDVVSGTVTGTVIYS
jgi:hypothetical protein